MAAPQSFGHLRGITSGLPSSIQKTAGTTPPAARGPRYAGPLMGALGTMQDPEKAGPGKSIRSQDLGSVVGRRGAGISQIGGGDQAAHSLNHYGKGGFPSISGTAFGVPLGTSGTGSGTGGGGF